VSFQIKKKPQISPIFTDVVYSQMEYDFRTVIIQISDICKISEIFMIRVHL